MVRILPAPPVYFPLDVVYNQVMNETLKRKMVGCTEEVIGCYSALKFEELQARCLEVLAEIPVESRKTASFGPETYTEGYYESSTYARFVMTYSRPETDQELAKRQVEHDERCVAQAARDRAEFERLSKQFGNK